MGRVLQRTALSTNIRERLDFSCALFDAGGGLVANAPHIPVHLGAMEETVKAVMAAHPDARAGDAFITNDPAGGGSHLPDITVVTPALIDGRRLWVASRGHHADVGGTTPGSMPPDSRRLEDEGVVLRALRAVHDGALDEALVRDALGAGPHPARNPDENLADLEAQLAANQCGVRLLGELAERVGLQAVEAYMGHVQDNAAEKVAELIASMPDGERRFSDSLDDGSAIAIRIAIRGARMTVDFGGSAPQLDGNLNAPRAVTIAALLYVLRVLVGEPIPLSSGCLRPVELILPKGSLLWPDADRAVAGGNVETSQRVVDVLLAALDASAASQGTMNNLTFGAGGWGYYETIAGGTGATAAHDGTSAVQSHMTNTRITDPEVLETRFSVRLVEYSIRRGSGGSGVQRGGDGVRRVIEAREPMTATILSDRRINPPFGLHGGAAGACGINRLGGREVSSRATVELAAGQRIEIHTPGGGGWGHS
jgi:5-oxoprolinase (ATP-hydrolysing)